MNIDRLQLAPVTQTGAPKLSRLKVTPGCENQLLIGAFRDFLTGTNRSRTGTLLSRFSVNRHAQNDRSIRSRTLKEHVFEELSNSTSQRRFLIRVSPGRTLISTENRISEAGPRKFVCNSQILCLTEKSCLTRKRAFGGPVLRCFVPAGYLLRLESGETRSSATFTPCISSK